MVFLLLIAVIVTSFVNNGVFGAIRLPQFQDLSDIDYNALAIAPLHVNVNDTHLFDYAPGVQLRLLHADPYTGVFVVLMIAKPGTALGVHRHLGTVYGYTIAGIWGYYEHAAEWMSHAGDLVFETVGSRHTLFASPKSPTDAVVLFTVSGALEFYDAYGEIRAIEDWSSIMQKYYRWCKARDITPYDVTGTRPKAVDAVFKSKAEKPANADADAHDSHHDL